MIEAQTAFNFFPGLGRVAIVAALDEQRSDFLFEKFDVGRVCATRDSNRKRHNAGQGQKGGVTSHERGIGAPRR